MNSCVIERSNYETCAKHVEQVGLKWELSAIEFEKLAGEPCYYCGSLPVVSEEGFVRNRLDCLDVTKGYVTGNIVACCPICSRAKEGLSAEEFFSWLDRIRRPKGDVEIVSIQDRKGKIVSLQDAYKRDWLIPLKNQSFKIALRDTRNLFVDNGRQITAYAFGFRSPVYDYTVQRFGIGTGLSPAKVTDVALESPVVLNNGETTKPIDAVDFLSPFTVRVAYTIALDDAPGYLLTEEGLFSGGKALIARKVRSVGINKTSDFSTTLTWRIRF